MKPAPKTKNNKKPMELNAIKKRVAKILDTERYEHSLRVADFAKELAGIYNVDREKAEIAALLHDVSRFMDRPQMLKEAKKLNFNISPMEEIEPKLLHAPLSANIAKNEFGIVDEEILSAIKLHTLGRPNMTDLEKIIYLADHAESGRDYPGIDNIRELAKKNLDQAIALSTSRTIQYLEERKLPIDQRTIETNQFYNLGEKT